MIEPLTPNTQAILLLTAPLLVGSGSGSPDLLTLGEYNRLARMLRESQKQPADLIGPDAQELMKFCVPVFGRDRLDTLLTRGFLLSQAVERWNARGIWTISRADARYPRRLKTRLKDDAPPLLYGCGEIDLLEKGGLAVVGSRNADEALISFTENVGRIAAQAHRSILSGGAKGIDRAAMHGALEAGGMVVGVMADSLERAALSRDNREPLMDGRLVLVSPYDPAAGFNVGHAMQRNKAIYALADAALVVASDFEKGGTWAGAIEQLDRLRLVPVFVRNGADASKGNSALLSRGGKPWPNPKNREELGMAIQTATNDLPRESVQETLPLIARKAAERVETESATSKTAPVTIQAVPSGTGLPPEAELLNKAREILCRELVVPRTEEEVAAHLVLTKAQAKAWLAHFVHEAVIEKIAKPKPVRFRTIKAGDRLL